MLTALSVSKGRLVRLSVPFRDPRLQVQGRQRPDRLLQGQGVSQRVARLETDDAPEIQQEHHVGEVDHPQMKVVEAFFAIVRRQAQLAAPRENYPSGQGLPFCHLAGIGADETDDPGK